MGYNCAYGHNNASYQSSLKISNIVEALPTSDNRKIGIATNGMLTIDNATVNDTDIYQCLAYNGHGNEVIIRTDLVVMKRTRIVTPLENHHHFNRGLPVSLPCNVEVSNQY